LSEHVCGYWNKQQSQRCSTATVVDDRNRHRNGRQWCYSSDGTKLKHCDWNRYWDRHWNNPNTDFGNTNKSGRRDFIHWDIINVHHNSRTSFNNSRE
jgi:hypothetical protein